MKNGRGARTRTAGLIVPNDARYHLRYTPISRLIAVMTHVDYTPDFE